MLKRIYTGIFIILLLLVNTRCSVTTLSSLIQDKPLTESEVIQGLKRALEIGSEKTAGQLSKPGGYLNDQLIKILLPDEATQVINALKKSSAGSAIYTNTLEPVVNDLVKAINSSAEEAAKESVPVFKDAITTMTFADAFAILNGQYKSAGAESATQYFRDNTYDKLASLYKPKVNTALNKPLVSNQSANQLWGKFVKSYNQVATSPANLLLKLEKVKEPDLPAYVTGKALNGLFTKVAVEEKNIRQDPYQYADSIVERVFGSIKK